MKKERKPTTKLLILIRVSAKVPGSEQEKVREFSRDSNRRRRGGEEKRKSGPPKGCKFTKQDFTERPVPTKEPVKAGRLCQQFINWPCFDGIENLESDFASWGCHGWKEKEK